MTNTQNPPDASGEDLDQFRDYLRLLARLQLDQRLQGKVDASDIVQQTLFEAHQGQEQFRGSTSSAKAAWLRKILARNLADEYRRYGRAKRKTSLERSLQQSLQESSCRLEDWIAAEQTTASQRMASIERLQQLTAAIGQLPEEQRRAVEMHHLQGLKTSEIAKQLDRSEASVAGLLRRGLKRMRELMSEK